MAADEVTIRVRLVLTSSKALAGLKQADAMLADLEEDFPYRDELKAIRRRFRYAIRSIEVVPAEDA